MINRGSPMNMRCIAALVAACSLSGEANSTTFIGEFWDVDTNIASLDEARAAIAGQGPDATFQSSMINYPVGSDTIADDRTLAEFLGADSASLVGDGSTTLERSVFRFTGFVDLVSGPSRFTVGSDDGFGLYVDSDFVAGFFDERAFRETDRVAFFDGGPTFFELFFFGNSGFSGVVFKVDEQIALPSTVAVVPLPLPAMLLGSAALGLFGCASFRRATA